MMCKSLVIHIDYRICLSKLKRKRISKNYLNKLWQKSKAMIMKYHANN